MDWTHLLACFIGGFVSSAWRDAMAMFRRKAYRSGVRDGYEAPWTPEVRRIITEDDLTPHQGTGVYSERHCWKCGRPGGKGAC